MKSINDPKIKIKQKQFLDSFHKELSKQPVVHDVDLDRSLRAIDLLIEHIRAFYGTDRSLSSLAKISKCARSLLVLEDCNNVTCVKSVREAELRVLSEAKDLMLGLNGMELALTLKQSMFREVQDLSDELMDLCAYRRVISNGAE